MVYSPGMYGNISDKLRPKIRIRMLEVQ